MSDHHNDDWHDDSASLFRSARRAHDPTPADRAALDRVLTRIQDASPSATNGSERAARAATSAKLAQIAKVSLAVMCIAAAYFALGRADRDAAAPRASTPPAAIAETPSPIPVPRVEPNALQPTRVASPEDASPTPRKPRRSRASADRHRPSKIEDAIVADAPSATTNAVAATREPARRESSLEPNVQPAIAPTAERAIAPTTDPEIAALQPAITELAVLKRMQAALHAADYKTALALCAEHERGWPHGTFELEREGVHAIAACGESSADAVPRAKAFLAKHPRAAVAMRVSSACGIRLQQAR